MNKLDHKKRGELLKVLLQYDSDWRKQIGVKPVKMSAETIKNGINCTAIGVESHNEFLSKFNCGDLCLYTNSPEGRAIPIEWEEGAVLYETKLMKETVCVDMQPFYDSYLLNCDQDGVVSITVSPNISFNIRKKNLVFHVNSDLYQLKKDIDFMEKLFEKECKIIFSGYFVFGFKYELEDDFKQDFLLIKMLYEMFSSIDINIKTPYSKLSPEDWKQVQFLLRIYNNQQDDAINDGTYYRLNIDNQCMVIFPIKDAETGKVRLLNIFRKNGYKTYVETTEHNKIEAPMFSMDDIDSDIFSKLSENDYRYIVEIMSEIERNEQSFNVMNGILLRIIGAYDISNKQYIIKASEIIAEKLIADYPTEEIIYVNYCQIKKRLGKLTDENRDKLADLRSRCNENIILVCCVNLLLENKYEAEMNYKNMSDEVKGIFDKYPISIFM